jgi:hypothetical protein
MPTDIICVMLPHFLHLFFSEKKFHKFNQLAFIPVSNDFTCHCRILLIIFVIMRILKQYLLLVPIL